MNRLVNLWNRARPADSIDSVEIDGEKRILPMAERARLPDEEIALSRNHFNNIIRVIARVPLTEIGQIRTKTYNTLKRVGAKRDTSKAVVGIPRGSSQIDVGSIGAWMDKIAPGDRRAIRQVIAIDATCCARGK